MTAITYLDDFGDTVTELPPFRDANGDRVAVSYNPTGFRLIPPGCWHHCRRPATVWGQAWVDAGLDAAAIDPIDGLAPRRAGRGQPEVAA